MIGDLWTATLLHHASDLIISYVDFSNLPRLYIKSI